jgi:hypothetical protein
MALPALDGGNGEHESGMALPAPALDNGGNGGNDEPANRRGRWHGLVYVPVPRSRRFVGVAGRAWRGTPRGELCRDAHLSLSRPFGLLRHEVEPFLARLRSALAARRCAPFVAVVDGGAALELDSEDGARRFEALRVDASPALHALVDAVDDALVAFGRPAFFDERRFHVSVATAAGRSRSRSRSRDGDDDFDSDDSGDSADDGDDRVYVDVDAVVCKYGHKHVEIALPG